MLRPVLLDLTWVKVDPGRLDDYLAGLKQLWGPSLEVAKKQGAIVDYRILVKQELESVGANIILIEEYRDWTAYGPNKDRKLALRTEARKLLPKSQADKIHEQFTTYRTFVDAGAFSSVEYAKAVYVGENLIHRLGANHENHAA